MSLIFFTVWMPERAGTSKTIWTMTATPRMLAVARMPVTAGTAKIIGTMTATPWILATTGTPETIVTMTATARTSEKYGRRQQFYGCKQQQGHQKQ
jgi:hypothetical protein